jgi:hypothetical protein
MSSIAPFLVFYLGALLMVATPERVRRIVALLVPVVGAFNLYALPEGVSWSLGLFDYELVLVQRSLRLTATLSRRSRRKRHFRPMPLSIRQAFACLVVAYTGY